MAESEPNAGHILLLVGRAPDRQVLAAMLTEAGYRVASSSPGPNCLAAIREAAPDLIVLGVGAPGEDGYEICSRVQADEQLWQLPILLAGVPGEPRDRERAFGAGAVDVLAKPFQREEVLARVGTHLALRAMRQRLAEAEARLEQVRTERQALESEWEAAQAALREAEERGRDLVENLSEVIFTAGPDGLVTYVSPGVEPFLGYRPAELMGCHVREVVHPDDHAPMAIALGQVLSGQRVTNEYRLLTKSGEVRWVQTSSQPAWEEGEVIGVQGVLVDITERRQAEEQIWQQNEFLHRVLESLTHPFYVVDAQDYTIQMANSAAQVEGLTGRATCYALTHGRDAPCEAEHHPCPLEQIKRTKKPVMVEHVHYAADGSPRHVEVHGYPLLDAAGNVTRVIEYALDVTERKEMEGQLRWELRVDAALSELYRPLTSPGSTIEEIAAVILQWARDLTGSDHGFVSSIDPDTGDNVGHTLTEMLGGACRIPEDESCIIFPRGSDGRYPGLWGASLNAKEAFYVNDVAGHPASSGTPEGHIPLERFLSVPVVLGDELVGQIALANPHRDYADRDLSAVRRLAEFYALAIQRKRVQDALRRERDVVSAILDTAGALVVVLDTEGRIVRVNRACERTTGYAFDEVEGVPFWELFLVPEEVAPVQAVFGELRAGQFPNQYENYWVAKDGSRRLIAWSNTALLDERGTVEYVIATGIDITARDQAESALRESEARWRSVTENSPDHVILLDRDLNIQFVNYASPGLTEEELIGTSLYSYVAEDRQLEIKTILEAVLETAEPARYETEYRSQDGDTIYYESRVVPRLLDGRVIGLAVNARDITELKRAERASSEARLAAEAARRDEAARRQEAERRRRIAESLAGVLAALNSNQPLDDVLDMIAAQGGELLESQAVAICSLSDGDGALAVRASYGLATGATIPSELPQGQEALTQAIALQQAVEARSLSSAPDEAGTQVHDGDPVPHQALLAVPIVVKDEVYGGILLYYPDPRAFSRDDVELAIALGNQVALAIENARLRDQIQEAAAAAERSRLARDLHDSVTQALFSATLVAEVLPHVWQRDPEEALEGVEELRHLTRGALAEMRTMLLELRPTALVETRLDELLRQLTEAITSRVQLPVVQEISAVPQMPPEVHVTFYRVAQEALHNVTKHAEAQQVAVYLGTSPAYSPEQDDGWWGRVVLRVRDDGRGFDVQDVGPDQLGLGIMRERAETVGVQLSIESHLGGGTEVTLVWEQG
jgi:PAS domain S-box-containing protein